MSFLKSGLIYRKLRPGPCLSPNLIEMIAVNDIEYVNLTSFQPNIQFPKKETKNNHLPHKSGRCVYYNQADSSCKLQTLNKNRTNGTSEVLIDHRPTGCKLFPIWPDIVNNEFDWFKRGPVLSNHSYQPITSNQKPVDAVTPHVQKLNPDEITKKLLHFVLYNNNELDEMDYESEVEALTVNVEIEDLKNWFNEFEQTMAKRIVFEDKEVIVIDSPCVDESSVVRSLIFQHRPQLIQSSIKLTQNQLEPSSIATSTSGSQVNPLFGAHHRGLAFGIVYYIATVLKASTYNTKRLHGPKELLKEEAKETVEGEIQRICSDMKVVVLGAGGCALPYYLAQLDWKHSRGSSLISRIVAVESSSSVIKVAQDLFLTPLINQSSKTAQSSGYAKLKLIHADASQFMTNFEWLGTHEIKEGNDAQGTDMGIDCLIIDIEDGSFPSFDTNNSIIKGSDKVLSISNSDVSGVNGCLVAPPIWCLGDDFLNSCCSQLSAPKRGQVGGGVLVVNVIASSHGVKYVSDRLKLYFKDVHFTSSHRHPPTKSLSKQTQEVVFFASCLKPGDKSIEEEAEAETNGEHAHLRRALQLLPLFGGDDPSPWVINFRQ